MKAATPLLLLATLCFGSSLSEKPTNSSLLIYNENRALVHETRDLKLSKHDTQLLYKDVASTINTDSINVTLPKGVELFSQQYRYDQLTLQKMLDAHIGKKISVKVPNGNKTFSTIKATLLSASGGYPLVKTHNGHIFATKVENILFDTIPDTLITKPSLVWNLSVAKDTTGEMQLDYLINNISFKSDYILNLQKEKGDLSGWLTINNHSGKEFKNTSLSLLAGDVNFVNKRAPKLYDTVAVMSEKAPSVQHQSFEGYHHYAIPFKVDIANNEKTQIKFLTLDQLLISRNYIANLHDPLFLQGEHIADVQQHLSFQTYDQPLPKGIIRVYSKLKSKTVLLGESEIPHTPKNTEIDLVIGKEFDLKVRQTVIDRDEKLHHLFATIAYEVSNNSEEQKNITLHIPFAKENNSKLITDEKYEYTKGNLVTFTFTMEPNTTKQFTVEYKKRR